jgi:hypothetical protein
VLGRGERTLKVKEGGHLKVSELRLPERDFPDSVNACDGQLLSAQPTINRSHPPVLNKVGVNGMHSSCIPAGT